MSKCSGTYKTISHEGQHWVLELAQPADHKKNKKCEIKVNDLSVNDMSADRNDPDFWNAAGFKDMDAYKKDPNNLDHYCALQQIK